MSLDKCIKDLVTEGKLSYAQGKDAREIYGSIKDRLSPTMSDAAAEALASERTVAALERKAKLTKRQALLQVKAQKNAIANMARYDRGSGKRPGDAAIALLVRDDAAPYSNVEDRHNAIRAQAHANMTDMLLKHSRNMLGKLRDQAGIADMVREAFGEKTGNESASQFNEAWQATAEWLRQRRNAAGGDTGKLADWGLPQSHDSLSVMQAGGAGATMEQSSQAWRDFVSPLLDHDRMVDGPTGLPMDGRQLDQALQGVFETIATDGWSRRAPGSQIGTGKLANRGSDHRFLIFKNADSWMQYQERFGGAGTSFDVMMRHIDSASREVALMEILGPNPTATVRWLTDGLAKWASLSASRKVRDGVFGTKARIGRIYGELTGANMQPENRAIALAFSSMRNVQVSSKLGSAVFTAINHASNQIITRAYNGLPVTRMMGSFLKQLNPLDVADRAHAMRMMLGADDVARALGDDSNMSFAEHGAEITRRLAEITMRISGLEPVVRANRYSFGLDTIAGMTNESVKGWDALDPRFRGMLDRYGMSTADWDSIRSTPLEEERGATWLKPGSIENPRLRDRVVEMILSETARVVPTDNLRMRADLNGLLPRGNVSAELARTAFQFKGFALSNLSVNARRAMSVSGLQGKLLYVVGYSALATLLGVFSNELREISKGNDPRPLSDPMLWAQGGFQGGSLGIYGDFLNSATSRSGGKLADVLEGPSWQTANQLGNLAIGDTRKSMTGDRTNRGRELTRLLQSETPVLSSTWYTRAAYQRALQYFLQESVDPQYGQAWHAMEQRAQKQGQAMWWQPGELTPGRAPDLGNAIHGNVPPPHQSR